MKHVTFKSGSISPTSPPQSNAPMSGQRRQVKTVILERTDPNEDWGLEFSGNGWQDGEWMRK